MGVPPPLFPYCRVLVNHRYRTLYLKAPKTGSTSLLTLLGTCTGDKAVDKPTCFEPLQVCALVSGQRADAWWLPCNVLTAVCCFSAAALHRSRVS